MRKKCFIVLIFIILVLVTLTLCGKDKTKRNISTSNPRVEKSNKDESKVEEGFNKNESHINENKGIDNRKSNTEINSKEQGNVVTEDTVLNSMGDNSNTKSSDYYIEELISNYEQLFVDANNNGDFSLIFNMIIQDSSFYKKQKESVERSYSNNVKYNLLDYNIKEIKEIDNKTYEVYVIEKMQIKGNDDADFQDKEFKYIYTVKFDDSGIGINNKVEGC